MKGIVKGIVIGLIIIIIGAAILITGLALSGWKIERSDFETRTFTAEGENTALNIEIGAGSVTTEFYDGDKVIIEYPVAKHFVSEAKERDGRVYYSSKFKWNVFFAVPLRFRNRRGFGNLSRRKLLGGFGGNQRRNVQGERD